MKRRPVALAAALVLLLPSPRAACATQVFPDVSRGAWYYRAVETAAERGWMLGVGDGTFVPNRTLGCHEFLTLLVRSLFPDLTSAISDPWYRESCDAALHAGLLEGTDLLLRLQASGGNWEQAGASGPLNRLDMAQMLCNALRLRGKAPENSSAEVPSEIIDRDAIPPRFRAAVTVCFEAGLLRDTGDGRFNGTDTVDRAQAAAVLCRLWETVTGELLQTDPLPEDVLAGLQADVLRLVNQRRAEAGLRALEPDPRLCAAAQIRADEITELFEHTRPDGSGCFTVLDSLGILRGTAGENIARGYDTPAEVVDGWMNSPDHRVNILDPAFRYLGVGCVVLGKRAFWVQLFTG